MATFREMYRYVNLSCCVSRLLCLKTVLRIQGVSAIADTRLVSQALAHSATRSTRSGCSESKISVPTPAMRTYLPRLLSRYTGACTIYMDFILMQIGHIGTISSAFLDIYNESALHHHCKRDSLAVLGDYGSPMI
jgi:hypothetical protein